MSELEMKPGWQAPHKVDKPWIACTIFCMQKQSEYCDLIVVLVAFFLLTNTKNIYNIADKFLIRLT
jgi:hypothetical protein